MDSRSRGFPRATRRNRTPRIPGFFLLALLAAGVLLPAGCAGWRLLDRSIPTLSVTFPAKAIGRTGSVTVRAEEPKWGVRSLRAILVQDGTEYPLGEKVFSGRPAWKFWGRGESPAVVETAFGIGRDELPKLRAGTATLRVEAINDSYAGFGSGRRIVREETRAVLLEPPRLEVLSSGHVIRQGGSECVVYRAGETAEASGVRVGPHSFTGYPLPGGAAGERFSLFAFAPDLPVSTRPLLFATDAAANESTLSFSCAVVPRRFRASDIPLEDAFLDRVVPEILSQSPSIAGTGDKLKDFLAINGTLRRENAATIAALSAASNPAALWHGAFRQLGNSAVQAGYADSRTYMYQGREVDHQTHLGFDLASVKQAPVEAGNDGVVVLARWLGIYGNTVILDHGWGVQSLYAHLSSIAVKDGQAVKRGETLGRTGVTGLAGGDHLHFGLFVGGVSVDPTEWWDAHWLHDRIETRLENR